MIEEYKRDGYVVIDTSIPSDTLAAAWTTTGPLQPEGYHWSDGPRVFEGWKSSQAVRDIAWCPKILGALELLHGPSRPFQTINFSKGTNQKMHQDAVHFQTLPLGEMVGVWVALEPMDEDNGTLCVVPGSHERGYFDWQKDMRLPKCAVGEQFAAYAEYENILEATYSQDDVVPIVCDAGQAVIWNSDLLHGGWPIRDTSRTRHSQVTHYYTDKARMGWAPMFSDPGEYDFCFKRMRWFDREGVQHEQNERP